MNGRGQPHGLLLCSLQPEEEKGERMIPGAGGFLTTVYTLPYTSHRASSVYTFLHSPQGPLNVRGVQCRTPCARDRLPAIPMYPLCMISTLLSLCPVYDQQPEICMYPLCIQSASCDLHVCPMYPLCIQSAPCDLCVCPVTHKGVHTDR